MKALGRVVSAVALAVSAGLATSAVGGASPRPATHVALSVARADRAEQRAYVQAVRAINRAFAAAVAAAKEQLRASLSGPRTPGQRFTARAQFRLAIAQASAARDAALVKLGPPPHPRS